MMLAWMVYATVAGLLITAAALAAERIARASRRSMRGVWMGAMLATVVWPCAAYVGARANVAAVDQRGGATGPARGAGANGVARVAVVAVRAAERALPVSATGMALIAWGALSTVLLARLAFAATRLQRRRAAWRAATVDGVAVRLSRDAGPAVVGLDPMEVVLPEWILALDAPLRAVVLTHEDEHRRARDPHVLTVAAVLVALVPWNVALVWQARRLRLAMELDCDARVLRAHPDADRYARVLVAIAQRRGLHANAFTAALLHPTSHLARRISAMKHDFAVISRTRLTGYVAAAVVAVVAACSVDTPPVPPVGAGASTHDQSPTASGAEPRAAVPAAPAGLRDSAPAADTSLVRAVRELQRRVELFAALERELKRRPSAQDTVAELTLAANTIDLGRRDPRTPRAGAGLNLQSGMHLALDTMTHAVTYVADTVSVLSGSVRLIADSGRYEQAAAQSQVQHARPGVAVNLDTVRSRRGPSMVMMMHEVAPSAVPGVKTLAEVSRAATQVAGTTPPVYPRALRDAGIEGDALAQFVVDESGRVMMRTVSILSAGHRLFAESVVTALRDMRFQAAELNGQPVKQLVQLEFAFQIR